MPSFKESLKDFVFRLKPMHFIVPALLILGIIIFLLGKMIVALAHLQISGAIWVMLAMAVISMLSRLSVFIKVGIGFMFFTLFFFILTFGPLATLIMLGITTPICYKIATNPTAVDFMIMKSGSPYLTQGIYVTLWILTMIPFFKIFGIAYVQAHLTFVFFLSLIIYVIYMGICLPIFAQEPVMAVINKIALMIPFQMMLVFFLGKKFLIYLMPFMK